MIICVSIPESHLQKHKVVVSEFESRFEIDRVDKDIEFERLLQEFVEPEKPVVTESVGSHWPARRKWTADYLQASLSREPSVRDHVVYYQMRTNTLGADYDIPVVVRSLIDCPQTFPQQANTRIWLNVKHNVSHWHYDSKFENVFNAQVKGRKRWTLISPQTPPACYPFSNFAILDDDEKVLKNKRHTTFELNEGDLLYVPPLWFHKVIALEDENINLNWVFTKRKTDVISRALSRELERYLLYLYFSDHAVATIRRFYTKMNSSVPPTSAYLGHTRRS